MTAIAAVIAVFVIIIGGLVFWQVDDTSRLHGARDQVQRICAPQGAVTYDVQGQDELVYACNADHVLRTLGY